MYMSKIIPDCVEENKTNYDNQVGHLKIFFKFSEQLIIVNSFILTQSYKDDKYYKKTF